MNFKELFFSVVVTKIISHVLMMKAAHHENIKSYS